MNFKIRKLGKLTMTLDNLLRQCGGKDHGEWINLETSQENTDIDYLMTSK